MRKIKDGLLENSDFPGDRITCTLQLSHACVKNRALLRIWEAVSCVVSPRNARAIARASRRGKLSSRRRGDQHEAGMLVSTGCSLTSEFHRISDIRGDQDQLLTGGIAQLFCIGQALPFFVND